MSGNPEGTKGDQSEHSESHAVQHCLVGPVGHGGVGARPSVGVKT